MTHAHKDKLMTTRRETLRQGFVVAGLLVSTGLFPKLTWATQNAKAFNAKNLAEVVAAMGIQAPVESSEVSIQGPDIAENGAVVPLSVATSVASVKQMLVVVEKNPSALVALYHVSDSVEASFTTRAKMSQSSDVYAVAILNDGKVLYAKKEITVTLGGCGN